MHKYLKIKCTCQKYLNMCCKFRWEGIFVSSSVYSLPSIQARFHTSNSKIVEATYHSNTKAYKETQS